jgi:hypothetical protein
MMKHAFTAVVERNVSIDGTLVTEPYETAWAGEGRWFVHVLSAEPDATLEIAAEISPDGLTWCPHEADAVRRTGPGLVSLPLRMLSPWQRLVLTCSSPRPAKAIVYLCLRE